MSILICDHVQGSRASLHVSIHTEHKDVRFTNFMQGIRQPALVAVIAMSPGTVIMLQMNWSSSVISGI